MIFMKKGLIITAVIVAIVAMIVVSVIGNYNEMIAKKENLDALLANVDTQLQRRNDLIPNLVNTVKGYSIHENEAIQAVSDARAKLAGADSTAEKGEADTQLSSALSRLLMVAENYPNLKADTQFTALTDELAGTENRIAVARKDYNDSAKAYNTEIKKFPRVIFANLFGFDAAEYFEASEDAQKVPEVNFE